MNEKKDQRLKCAICGIRPATTSDHIPPKGIFAKPRPTDLITIPSCFECNHEASKFDESFRVYLSLHVGTDDPVTERLWTNHALRTLRRNRKLKHRLLNTSRSVYIRSPGGLIVGKRQAFLWDSEAHTAVIERIIRGLYYHHFGEILGDQVTCKIHWLRKIPEEIYEMSKEWKQHSIGRDQVIYRYGRDEDGHLHSTWVFQFYGRYWASGYTEPKTPT